jgi:hypothetical protein
MRSVELVILERYGYRQSVLLASRTSAIVLSDGTGRIGASAGPDNKLASLFRDTLRQFFHGSIEKTRCHNQTGRQFRVLVALNYPAHVQFQSANFLEQFDDVNGIRIRYRSIGVHVPTLLPVTQSLKFPRLGPGWPIIGMFRGSH